MRLFQPKPPCRRYPPSATPRQWPTGKKSPSFISVLSRSLPPTPGPAVAVSAALSIVRSVSPDRSITTPASRMWFPDQPWPPDRTPMCFPSAFAARTAAITSSTEEARTMRSGNRAGTFAFHIVPRRAASYPAASRVRDRPLRSWLGMSPGNTARGFVIVGPRQSS